MPTGDEAAVRAEPPPQDQQQFLLHKGHPHTMSLYYDTSAILENKDRKAGSLKSRIFGNKALKSPPIAVFALATEATKWSNVLKDVIEKSSLLSNEKKVDRFINISYATSTAMIVFIFALL